MAQFAVNNSWQETIQNTPFYLNHGLHPATPATVGIMEDAMPDAKELTQRLQESITRAKTCYHVARNRYNQYNSKNRKKTVEYKSGELVLLSTANMRPKQGIRKLMPRWVGPFHVVEHVGPVAVRLRLTNGFERLHDVFHVSKIKSYTPRKGVPLGTATPMPLEWVDGDPVYEVEAVVDHQQKEATRKLQGKKEGIPGKYLITAYRVRWKGFRQDQDTWEPCSNLKGAPAVTQYWKSQGLTPETHKEVTCRV